MKYTLPSIQQEGSHELIVCQILFHTASVSVIMHDEGLIQYPELVNSASVLNTRPLLVSTCKVLPVINNDVSRVGVTFSTFLLSGLSVCAPGKWYQRHPTACVYTV